MLKLQISNDDLRKLKNFSDNKNKFLCTAFDIED